jgi:hypothetical protein
MLMNRKKEWGSYKEIVIKNGLLSKLRGKGNNYEMLGLKMI